jgi:FkbM family methyltransferase
MGPRPIDYLLRAFAHQRWIPKGRDFVLRRLAHPSTRPSTPFEVPFFGLKYRGNLNNFLDWSVFYYGAYARNELLLMRHIALKIGRPLYFFDVGANIGHHSLFMSQYADHVYGFEPFPAVATEYERKMIHAGVTNATLFSVALGAVTGQAPLSIVEGENLGTSTLTRNLPSNASGETLTVPVVRGDEFLAAQACPPMTLLKIDVEGYEAQVLKGLASRLKLDRPVILMEVSGPQGRGFADEADFHAALYPDHHLFEVSSKRDDYCLLPFCWQRGGEVLVMPDEVMGKVWTQGVLLHRLNRSRPARS